MNSIGKKAIVYSLAAIMNLGLFTAATEASPRHREEPQRLQMDDREHHDEHKEQERHERERRENERHEREMHRRDHESEREWHERQEREKERHDREMQNIAALLIGVAIGAAGN